ncbi:hypothetical protein [Chryseobacterium flavum]|uniref:hypothetical protein n=1 Tax=Chryseobacterium flavum TaxID=415851 RepID=UPI0028A59816|nr:hypothetical protein [Chryseobacterium flavum]
MGTNKGIEKLSDDNLNDWLQSFGYLYPTKPHHLRRFEKLYEDYDFKLKNHKVDVKSIIDGSFCEVSKTIEIKMDSNTSFEIDSLKMVARKGSDDIPDHIKEKMKQNHKKKKGDSE